MENKCSNRKRRIYYIIYRRNTSFFDGYLSGFFILSTASCKYIFCHVILMDCCFSSLIRLSRYLSSQFMSGDGMSFSGSLEMIVNNKSSALLWKFWKNSFIWLRSLSSMSIVINSLNFLYSLEKSAYFINSIGQSVEKDNK